MRWEIHTLDGFFMAAIHDRADGQVTRTLNGGRTARVTVSIYDEACRELVPTKRLLKVWDGDTPIFGGVILLPEWSGEEGTVVIAAQDPSWRLDKAPLLLTPIYRPSSGMPPWYVRAGIDPNYVPSYYGPPTYASLDELMDAARPGNYGFPDAPDHGVKHYEGATRGPMPILEIGKGESVWALAQRCSQSAFGPDFDLLPIEQEPGTWDYTELGIYQRLGVERQDLTFHYRHGVNNVVDASYRPGGDQLCNAFFSAYDVGDSTRLVNYYDPASIAEAGFVAQYESTGCEGSAGKGVATVAAYREVPKFFTFQPAIEAYAYAGREDERFGAPPLFGRDYDLGDTIKVSAKRGYFEQELEGRATEVTLKEIDQAGNVQAEVTIVPRVGLEGIEAATALEGE